MSTAEEKKQAAAERRRKRFGGGVSNSGGIGEAAQEGLARKKKGLGEEQMKVPEAVRNRPSITTKVNPGSRRPGWKTDSERRTVSMKEWQRLYNRMLGRCRAKLRFYRVWGVWSDSWDRDFERLATEEVVGLGRLLA